MKATKTESQRYPIKSFFKYSAISAVALANSLSAIERPSPTAQLVEKTHPSTNQDQALQNPEINTHSHAFLGVFGEPVSQNLSAHLNLPFGTGIQLQIIAKDSPASQAGLKKHDIITSLAGQKISSQDDLRAAVTKRNPGDEVAIQYIASGKTISKKLTLAAKTKTRQARTLTIPQLKNNHALKELEKLGLPKEFLNKFSKQDRQKLIKLTQKNLAGIDIKDLAKQSENNSVFYLNLDGNTLDPNTAKELDWNENLQSRLNIVDEEGSISLEKTKEGKIIELLSKAGDIQYHGPYNNVDDKKKIPAEFHSRVEKLDSIHMLGCDKKITVTTEKDNKEPLKQQPKPPQEELKNNGDAAAENPGIDQEILKQLPQDIQNLLKNNKGARMLNLNKNKDAKEGEPAIDKELLQQLPKDIQELLKNNDGVQMFQLEKNNDANQLNPDDNMLKALPKDIQALLKNNKNIKKFKMLQLAQNADGKLEQVLELVQSGDVSSFEHHDPETGNLYLLKEDKGNKQLEIHDADGSLLFDGPYNTDADKASVPNDLRDFIEKMNTQKPLIEENKVEQGADKK